MPSNRTRAGTHLVESGPQIAPGTCAPERFRGCEPWREEKAFYFLSKCETHSGEGFGAGAENPPKSTSAVKLSAVSTMSGSQAGGLALFKDQPPATASILSTGRLAGSLIWGYLCLVKKGQHDTVVHPRHGPCGVLIKGVVAPIRALCCVGWPQVLSLPLEHCAVWDGHSIQSWLGLPHSAAALGPARCHTHSPG